MIEKVMPAADAVSLINDGDTVALQAGPTQCTPMSLIREIIRSGRRDLHVVCLSGSVALDWLATAGCLGRCTFAAVTMEHFGLCARFRRGVESGAIAVEELSETALLARLGAAARGLPFLPTRGMIGTDLLHVGNPALKVIDDPFGSGPFVACAALEPDVALLHAHRADRFGNVGTDPAPRHPGMTTMPRAAKRVVVSVERIVDTDELRRAPDRTILPGFTVDAVVEASHGAHPTSLFPRYDYDAGFLESWVEAAADDGDADHFLQRHVFGAQSHEAYLDLIGADRLTALTKAMTAPAVGTPEAEQGLSRP